jgi:hypothetical protein
MMSAATFRINAEQSKAFAALSGDRNPLHVDPTVARRLLFGGTVVHGVHVLLTALNAFAQTYGRRFALDRVAAEFFQPIATDQEFTVAGTINFENQVLLTVESKGVVGAKISCTLHPGDWAEDDDVTQGVEPVACRALSFEDAVAAHGTVVLGFDARLADTFFQHLCVTMPARQLAALLAATRIVGMECPGRHSIFAGLDLRFAARGEPSSAIVEYRVERADRRLWLLMLGITGGGVEGMLTARFRPSPAVQIGINEARALVRDAEFAAQRALVIGGSRGLGELVAKLIVAGGGEAWITYHSGSEDAARVAQELSGTGRLRGTSFYDARDASALASTLPPSWRPTHLYFFATPAVRPNVAMVWSEELFQLYHAYYADGLLRALEALGADRDDWSESLTVFYPSTVFIDESAKGFVEYAAAKAEGEAFCHSLAARFPWLRCVCPRLPRMLTDQTNTLGGLQRLPPRPAPIILPLLRDAAKH